MSDVLDRPITSAPVIAAPPSIHPDVLRLMKRPGYYLSADEPIDIRKALAQLAEEDAAWTKHMTHRENT